MPCQKSRSYTRGGLLIFALAATPVVHAQSAQDSRPDPEPTPRKEQSTQELDSIQVLGERPAQTPVSVGGKLALPVREVPRSISVIGREQLDQQGITALSRAVERATGVYVRDQGDMDDGPLFYARGFLMSVSENGVPFDTTYYGAGLDTALYERIEILRGPDGLMQGQGQLGGTVNLVRKRPTETAQGSVRIVAGQWDQLRGVLDLSQPLRADGAVRGRAVLSAETRDSYLPHVGSEKYQGYGVVDVDIGEDTTLSFQLQRQKSTVNPNFGALYDGTRYTPRDQYAGASWSRFDLDRTDAGIGLEQALGAWRLEATLNHRRYDDAKRFAFHNPHPALAQTGRSALINRATWFDGRQWTGDAHASGRFDAFGRSHQLVLGANFERFAFDNYTRNAPNVGLWEFGNPDVPLVALEKPDPRHTRIEQSGLYAQGLFALGDSLHLHLGSRFSRYLSRSTPTGGATVTNYDETGVFTPYGGLVWELSPTWNAYVSYADIFRPQSYGTNNASGKQLPPLVGRQLEIGTKAGFLDDRLLLSAALFDARDTNRAIRDPLDPDELIAAGEIESRGAEFEVSGRLAEGWDAIAGYTYTRTRYSGGYGALDGADFNDFSPRHSFKLWTTYTFPTGGRLAPLSAGLGMRAFSESRLAVAAPFVFTARQPGYAVVDLRLGWKLGQRTEIAVLANNVFDREYVAAPNIRAFYGEPRHLSLDISRRW